MELIILITLYFLYITLEYLYNKSINHTKEPELGKYVEQKQYDNPFTERKEFYISYLKSDTWSLLRLFIFDIRDGKCEQCNTTIDKYNLFNVHHITYERLGSERLSDLALLCMECHEKIHKFHPKNNKFYPLLTKEQFVDMSVD